VDAVVYSQQWFYCVLLAGGRIALAITCAQHVALSCLHIEGAAACCIWALCVCCRDNLDSCVDSKCGCDGSWRELATL